MIDSSMWKLYHELIVSGSMHEYKDAEDLGRPIDRSSEARYSMRYWPHIKADLGNHDESSRLRKTYQNP